MESPVDVRQQDRLDSQAVLRQKANVRLRWASAFRLARRELLAAVNSPGLYLMVTLGCVVVAVIVKSYLDYVRDNGTLVLASPFKAPLIFAVMASTGFLGLVAAAGLAGERERGTLEVLFYGPVDGPTFIAGKLLGLLSVYGLAMIALAIFLGIASLLTGMTLGAETLLLLVSSLLPATSMIALGLLLAAMVGRLRPAVAVTAGVLILFIAIDVGSQVAASQPGDSVLGFAAGMISWLSALVGWISPFGYIWRAANAFAISSASGVLLDLAGALLYSLALIWLSIVTLRNRGVQRWRE